jgi:hypothetical protein
MGKGGSQAENGPRLKSNDAARTVSLGVLGMGGLFFASDAFEDLFAMNCHVTRRIDADPDLISFHAQHGHSHVAADHDGFTDTPRKNQHFSLLAVVRPLNTDSWRIIRHQPR